jgi:hypothetical protein
MNRAYQRIWRRNRRLAGLCARCSRKRKKNSNVCEACTASSSIFKIRKTDRTKAKEAKNKKCIICNRRVPLEIDHCHKTGKFRGRICHRCNMGLGQFRDSIRLLIRVILYLRGEL